MSYISEIRPQDIEHAQENTSWCDEHASALRIYAYTDNDPLNQTDPSGNCPWCIGAAIGAVSGGTAGYIAGGYKGLFIGAVVGAGVGLVAPQFSAQAAAGALAITGSSTVAATTGAVVFTAINAGAGAGAAIATNVAMGNPTFRDVGTGAVVGGMAPLLSGEAALVGLGGAAARGLPVLADYALSAQTGVVGLLGTAATSLTPPAANSNYPTSDQTTSQKMK